MDHFNSVKRSASILRGVFIFDALEINLEEKTHQIIESPVFPELEK